MNIRNLTIEELEIEIEKLNEKKFRAKQIFEWLHKHKVESIDEMTNLSTDLRDKIKNLFETDTCTIEKEFVSKIDETKKYLIKLHDGFLIESVLMKYKYGYTVCISSEVGCDMGCKFCASTIGGMKRNLEAYEMLSQIYLIEKKNNIDISNVVIMGSGEPLCNFTNVIKFLKLINSSEGQNLGLRNVTISTCGIVPKIKELADLKLQITLALSLHAPSDLIRKTIMPIADKYTLNDTMDAMAYYFIKTGRRITFEYSLIHDVNDSETDAKNLDKLFRDRFSGKHVDFNVNLIPVNEVKETKMKRPDMNVVNNFKDILENNGINATIRRELGSDISGSCGQLRARES